MAKMLMGQIDHARNRIKALKAEKLGHPPEGPALKGSDALLKGLRDGSITVTGPQLKKAFEAYISETPDEQVDEIAGNYRNNYEVSFRVVKRPPRSVEDALATAIYFKENSAEVARYKQETELFNLNRETLELEASCVEDAIVLGDQHAALQALQDFADFKL